MSEHFANFQHHHSRLKATMPRLLPSDKCPKCQGPMKRMPTMIGSVYACAKCDPDNPLRSPEIANLLNGELRPFQD